MATTSTAAAASAIPSPATLDLEGLLQRIEFTPEVQAILTPEGRTEIPKALVKALHSIVLSWLNNTDDIAVQNSGANSLITVLNRPWLRIRIHDAVGGHLSEMVHYNLYDNTLYINPFKVGFGGFYDNRRRWLSADPSQFERSSFDNHIQEFGQDLSRELHFLDVDATQYQDYSKQIQEEANLMNKVQLFLKQFDRYGASSFTHLIAGRTYTQEQKGRPTIKTFDPNASLTEHLKTAILVATAAEGPAGALKALRVLGINPRNPGFEGFSGSLLWFATTVDNLPLTEALLSHYPELAALPVDSNNISSEIATKFFQGKVKEFYWRECRDILAILSRTKVLVEGHIHIQNAVLQGNVRMLSELTRHGETYTPLKLEEALFGSSPFGYPTDPDLRFRFMRSSMLPASANPEIMKPLLALGIINRLVLRASLLPNDVKTLAFIQAGGGTLNIPEAIAFALNNGCDDNLKTILKLLDAEEELFEGLVHRDWHRDLLYRLVQPRPTLSELPDCFGNNWSRGAQYNVASRFRRDLIENVFALGAPMPQCPRDPLNITRTVNANPFYRVLPRHTWEGAPAIPVIPVSVAPVLPVDSDSNNLQSSAASRTASPMFAGLYRGATLIGGIAIAVYISANVIRSIRNWWSGNTNSGNAASPDRNAITVDAKILSEQLIPIRKVFLESEEYIKTLGLKKFLLEPIDRAWLEGSCAEGCPERMKNLKERKEHIENLSNVGSSTTLKEIKALSKELAAIKEELEEISSRTEMRRRQCVRYILERLLCKIKRQVQPAENNDSRTLLLYQEASRQRSLPDHSVPVPSAADGLQTSPVTGNANASRTKRRTRHKTRKSGRCT